MSLIRKFTLWFLFGAAFGCGVIVAGYLALRFMGPELSDHEIVTQFLEEEEEELGVSCEIVYSEAMIFIRDKLRPIIEAGRAGNDLAAQPAGGFLADLERHEDRISRCQMMNVAASSVELAVHNDFDDLHKLLITVDVLLDPDDSESPGDRNLRARDFELLEKFYREANKQGEGA